MLAVTWSLVGLLWIQGKDPATVPRRRAAPQAPGERYPYTIKAVNDSSINAFALPGGPMYVNRGLIEAARSESELAGVLAHENGSRGLAVRHPSGIEGLPKATSSFASIIATRVNRVRAVASATPSGRHS